MSRFLKTPEALIILVGLWLAFFCNAGFWEVIDANKPEGVAAELLYFSSFLFLTVGLISLVFLLLAFGRATRVVLGLALLTAAAAGYFTANYGVLFDPGMLTNIVQTDRAEASELLSFSQLIFIAVFGVLPALAIWRYPILPRPFPRALMHRSIALLLALGLITAPLVVSQKEIFSVGRNNQEIRHMIAPLNVISASYVSVRDNFESVGPFVHVALDATHANATLQNRKPRVHVLIVGETARAANFSLNGYAIDTNPELEKINSIRFFEVQSCGTATAVSLPCMFSVQGHKNFDAGAARNEDNLLDVAKRSGYDVHWIDNGNSCKGICTRVDSQNVHEISDNRLCPDGICYDEILVEELGRRLSSVTADSIFVLHQLGSHGPAYFRRYPDAFRIFEPACDSANFGDCTQQEIANAYDNTIAYTDHVIAATIRLLQSHAEEIEASLLYISDHGESLGEHNVYLHGMPYKFAPKEQTTVPMIAWFSTGGLRSSEEMLNCSQAADAGLVSHDNLFHTELGIMAISTSAYRPDLDIFSTCRNAAVLADISKMNGPA